MFKRLLLGLMLLITSSLYSTGLGPIVDYGKYPHLENGYYANYNPEAWALGWYAFNYAPELTPFFALLKRDYQIDSVVETGTFRGGTTVVFSYLYDQVYSIEVNEKTYGEVSEKLKPYSNVKCYLGSSAKILNELLPTLRGTRLLFYLDAHWQKEWPLLEELEAISKTHKDNCIIVIDDFKVPARDDIPFDAYGPHECSFDYVRTQLEKVYTSYSFHFLIPKSGQSRAKFVAIPKQWSKHESNNSPLSH